MVNIMRIFRKRRNTEKLSDNFKQIINMHTLIAVLPHVVYSQEKGLHLITTHAHTSPEMELHTDHLRNAN